MPEDELAAQIESIVLDDGTPEPADKAESESPQDAPDKDGPPAPDSDDKSEPEGDESPDRGDGDDEKTDEGAEDEDKGAEKDEKEDKDTEGDEEEPEGDFDSETKPDLVRDKDGKKMWYYTESRGRNLVARAKRAHEYDDLFGSVDDAKKDAGAAMAWEELHSYFRSGEPNKVGAVLAHLNEQSPDALAVLGMELARGAKTENKPAYEAMQGAILEDLYEGLYEEYASMDDKDAREAKELLFAAQVLNFRHKGEYRDKESIKPSSTTDRREADLRKREEALANERKSRADQESSAWIADTIKTTKSRVNELVAETLKPIDQLKSAKPFIYKAARQSLLDAVQSAIEGDKNFFGRLQLRYSEAAGTRTDEDRKDLVNRYLNRARRAINSASAEVIKQATESVVQESGRKHKKLADSEEAGKRDATGDRAPGKQPLANPNYEKAKGEKDLEGMISALVSST